jgi:hypothetical protein
LGKQDGANLCQPQPQAVGTAGATNDDNCGWGPTSISPGDPGGRKSSQEYINILLNLAHVSFFTATNKTLAVFIMNNKKLLIIF